MTEKVETSSIQKFDGSNYNQWRFQIQCALRAKELFDVAGGNDVRPEEAGNVELN